MSRMLAFTFCLTAGWALPSSAQFVLMSPLDDYYDWKYDVGFESTYQTNAQIDGGGSFDALQFKAKGSIGGPISHPTRLYLDLAYTHTQYNFDTGPASACTDPRACFDNAPWEDVHTLDIAPGASLILSQAIRIQVFVPIRWHAESDSDRGGVTAGFITDVRVRFSDRLTVSLGVGVQSELEEDATVFPVITLDWRATESLQIVTRGDPYQGGQVALVLGNQESLQFTLSAGYERDRFRLSDQSPDRNGVAEVTSVPLLAGFDLNIGRSVKVSLEGGVALRGRLELDSPHGAALRKEAFDTAGLIRGQFHLTF